MQALYRVGALAFAIFMAGCATRWEKPGASADEFDAMKAACTSSAWQRIPPMMQEVQITSGYYAPIQTSCSGFGYTTSCYQTGGQYVPPISIPVDQNGSARAQEIKACFYENGWHPAKEQ